MYMQTYKKQDVLLAVQNIFPEKDVQIVMMILDKYGAGSDEHGCSRVQLAILKLSNNKIEKVKEYVDKANQDFRDVLYWAEYTKEDKRIENPYEVLFGPPRVL